MEFRVLGPLEVVEDGKPLALPSGHGQRALLVCLLLHRNEVVPAERLIEAIWPVAAPATAGKIVQNYVSHARKVLGGRLATRSPGYVLEVRDGELDAERAEALAARARSAEPAEAARLLDEALALWRGSPLVDVAYDAFAQPEIGRLEELRLALVEQRIDADLRLGRHEEVVGELEALVAEHPLRERLRAQLMRALYRGGRQAEALEVYASGRRALVDELGLEPGEELQDLQRAILAHDPALTPPALGETRTAARRRRLLVAGGAALALAAALAVSLALATGGSGSGIVVRPNSVAVVDPQRNAVVADIPVGLRPTALAVGGGAVWVANADDGTVTKIDAVTRKPVATIGIGGDVSDVAIGFGSVWVADGNQGTLTRIDPHENAVTRTISFGRSDPLVPEPVFLVAVGAGSVWVSRGDELLRIDPRTNAVVARRPAIAAYGLAVGGGAVWVSTGGDQLIRFDADTLERTASTQFPDLVFSPVLGGGSLWASIGGQQVSAIDQQTAVPFRTISFDGRSPAIAWKSGSLWVCDDFQGRLLRLDPDTARVAATVRLAGSPVGVATGDRLVWVAVQKALG